MMFFLLVCGAVAAYVLQKWIGVAYYLLILDAVIAVGFLLFLRELLIQARVHLRDVVIPEWRCRRLVAFYNQHREAISPLNVHRGRMAEFGLLGDGSEIVSFDGISAEDVMSLRGRIFYLINTHSSIELWERDGRNFGEVAAFGKSVVTVSARPTAKAARNSLWEAGEVTTDEHSLELRFPESSYILLTYTSV